MQNVKTLMALCLIALLAVPVAVNAKDKKKKSKVQTISYVAYNLDPGPRQSQAKSNIEINLEVIRLADIYKYPGLFAFNPDELAKNWNNRDETARDLKWLYAKGPDGLSWENPFAAPGGRVSLLMCWAKIINNTDHILRMKDARVYLIPEDQEPMSAYNIFESLLGTADLFEEATNRYMAEQSRKGFIRIQLGPRQLPKDFFRTLVRSHKNALKLVNDLGKEVLPGFTYEGFLIFPAAPDLQGAAKISFFDITTKMDVAGNPTEKARFDFALKREQGSMWYDKEEKMWKEGLPPGEGDEE